MDGHVLLIPIECVSTRAQLPAVAARDLLTYQTALERMHATRGLACLRFERALRTQGQRNHMQVHVLPLTAEQVQGAVAVFLALCGHYEVHFHEITVSADKRRRSQVTSDRTRRRGAGLLTDSHLIRMRIFQCSALCTRPDGMLQDARLSIEEFLVNLSGGEAGEGHSEYFCIEIPYGDDLTRHVYRRFVYVPPPTPPPPPAEREKGRGMQRGRFPMHFGTEAAARMIGQPERANWKRCVQEEAEFDPS